MLLQELDGLFYQQTFRGVWYYYYVYLINVHAAFSRSPLFRRTRARHSPRHKSRRRERGKKKWKRHNKPPPHLHHDRAKRRPATCSIRGGKLALQTISILPGNLWKANIHAKRWRRRRLRNTYYYTHTGRCGSGVRAERCGIYIYMSIMYWSSTCPFAGCGARRSLLNLCRGVYWLSERTAAVRRMLPNIKTAQKEAARNTLAGDDCVRFILVSGPQTHV